MAERSGSRTHRMVVVEGRSLVKMSARCVLPKPIGADTERRQAADDGSSKAVRRDSSSLSRPLSVGI